MARPDDQRDVVARIGQAKALLAVDPRRAAALARTLPPTLEVRFLLGAALRRSGDAAAALEVLTPLAVARPGAWGPHYEQGMALAMLGRGTEAIAALERATAAEPRAALAWHALGDLYGMTDPARALEAQARLLPGSIGDAAFVQAVLAWIDTPGSATAEALRARFGVDFNDPAALRLLADVAVRERRDAAAKDLLTRAVAAAPRYAPARFHRAVLLFRLERFVEASAVLEPLLTAYVVAPPVRALHASALMSLGREPAAVEEFAAALAITPADARLWHAYGHALRSVGRQGDAVAAYRHAIAIEPQFGEAYWSLANLKTWRFAAEDVAAIRGLLGANTLGPDDRAHLHFALGKALEDAADYEPAFQEYQAGNAARRAATPYDAAAHSAFVQRSIATYSPAFFAERAAVGCAARDPIFVLGMPRSGSTLLEQILASHSQVEGLSELPDITALAAQVRGQGGDTYPQSLADLPPAAFAELANAYLERTRPRRQTDAPHFVDKFPGNFLHIGLIHLILPNARIIDVRRHPLACCVSLFKQGFAAGQGYSYDLADLGRYYADYVALMAHVDVVLPGRVHRVSYEALVDAPERELRALLEHVGLAFEPGCLAFFENERAVRTPSSEQVRQPIYRDGLDQWRHFEPWLEPLKAALGTLANSLAIRQ
ncbi:sulfotransferase [Sphingomonas sp. MMS24-J45]|uniref:tetratricopeptide repeat-containing sulfotransferase family protein n=1 Tax=Sphingomonas sp. MMS24-J45 TaxID=3238806 RepID=UPI0038502CF3